MYMNGLLTVSIHHFHIKTVSAEQLSNKGKKKRYQKKELIETLALKLTQREKNEF